MKAKGRIAAMLLLLCSTLMGHQAWAQTWTSRALEDGATYYILNKEANLFVGDDCTLQERGPLSFTASVAGNTCKLMNKYGGYAMVEVEGNSGILGNSTPKSMDASFDGAETELTFSGSAETGYRFSVTASWKYGILNRSASFTGYITANDGSVVCSGDASDANNVWVLVGVDEYNASPVARQDALERLDRIIEETEAALEAYKDKTPAFGHIALQARLTASKLFRSNVDKNNLFFKPKTTEEINKEADELDTQLKEYVDLSEYYLACLEEIETAEELGGAMSVACTTAKAGLNAATSKDGMKTAMNTLRTAATLRLQTGNSGTGFDDDMDFTGIIGNSSFDRGDMSDWYTLKVDAGAAIGSIGDIINAANGGGFGDLSKIAEFISLGEFHENSHPVVNEGHDAMTNGHNRYYYYTHDDGQMAFQPIIGLPAGAYRASAWMNSRKGLLDNNNCHISVITIPTSVLGDVISGVDLGALVGGNTDDVLKGVLANLGEVIGKGALKSVNAKASKNEEFVEVSLDFEINETSVALLVLNASNGLIPLPLVGTGWFKADHVCLTHIKSQKRALSELSNAIANADVPEANVAPTSSDDRPFTYNQKLVNDYQKALDDALSVQAGEELSATKVAEAAKKFADFEASFFEKAFQGPSAKGIYNLVMQDESASCTGHAVTFTEADETYDMQFAEPAGTTNYHQAVAFEKAGDAVNAYVISMTDKDGEKVYLKGNSALTTTSDADDATVYSIIPSTKVETVTAISHDGRTLGVVANSMQLAGVSGNNTYKAISVMPAAQHEVTLNITPIGWGTFMLPYAAEIPSGVKAYKAVAVETDKTIQLEEVNTFEACVPYLVEAEGGTKVNLSGIALATKNIYPDELLTGAFSLTQVAANAGCYLLQNQQGRLGFYLVADEGLQVGANHAFLTYEGTREAKMLTFTVGDATSIGTIDTEATKDVIFDLSGRRVTKVGKGVYIINGEKGCRF